MERICHSGRDPLQTHSYLQIKMKPVERVVYMLFLPDLCEKDRNSRDQMFEKGITSQFGGH